MPHQHERGHSCKPVDRPVSLVDEGFCELELEGLPPCWGQAVAFGSLLSSVELEQVDCLNEAGYDHSDREKVETRS